MVSRRSLWKALLPWTRIILSKNWKLKILANLTNLDYYCRREILGLLIGQIILRNMPILKAWNLNRSPTQASLTQISGSIMGQSIWKNTIELEAQKNLWGKKSKFQSIKMHLSFYNLNIATHFWTGEEKTQHHRWSHLIARLSQIYPFQVRPVTKMITVKQENKITWPAGTFQWNLPKLQYWRKFCSYNSNTNKMQVSYLTTSRAEYCQKRARK